MRASLSKKETDDRIGSISDEGAPTEELEVRINARAAIARWRLDPLAFVQEFLGLNGTADVRGIEPTDQQKQLLEFYRLMLISKMKNEERLVLTEREKPFGKAMGISVMAAKGVGKNACLAWIILHQVICFHENKSPITGPSYEQVRDIQLAEVSKWLNFRKIDGTFACLNPKMVEVQSDRIFLKELGGKNHFFKVRTAASNSDSKTQEEVLGGWHERFMTVIVDEATRVKDKVLKSLDSTLTQCVNFAILLFNPNRKTGYAMETHYGERAKAWVQIHWDARKSPLISPQQLQNMLETYGEDSPEYRINVLGLPPTEDAGSLIPYAWCMESVERYENSTGESVKDEPRIMAVDPAREGPDKTGIVVRQGRRLIHLETIREPDSRILVDWILGQIEASEPDLVYVDTIGMGGPIYDMLRHYHPRTRPLSVSKASNYKQFLKLRDQLWWKLREKFQDGLIDIPNHRGLINELCSVGYSTTGKGFTQIENKRKMRSRGVASPNLGDALMMTMMATEGVIQGLKNKRVEEIYRGDREKRWEKRFENSRCAWMVV